MSEFDSKWSINAVAVNAILQAAEGFGANTHALLQQAGIDKQWLLHRDYRLPLKHLFLLYDAANAATNNPDLALYTGRIKYISGLNLQRYMATICRTFRDYLNLVPSILQLTGDIGAVKINRAAEFIRLEWQPLMSSTRQQRFLTDETLSSSAMIVNSLCLQPIPVIKAEFSYSRPQDLTQLKQCFGSDLSFNKEVSCLYFDQHSLDYPILQTGQGIRQDDDSHIQSLFEKGAQDNFLRDLRQSLTRSLPSGETSVDNIAANLKVSRRTLQRRLSERNTQFMQVLQQVRADLARRYLRDKNMGVTEVAFLLGYSDQSSFSAAFKGWFGETPSEFRQR